MEGVIFCCPPAWRKLLPPGVLGAERAEALAARLTAGTVVAFTGDLGAGKTAFTRGLARGLGVPDRVTSPTFTIVNEYEGGRLPLFHFDMYRLGSSDELLDVCAVEWSEIVSDALEDGVLRVDIRRGAGEGERIITITGGTDA